MGIPYFVPPIGDEEIEAVTAVLRSGWLTTGPNVAAFEKEFAESIGGDCEAVSVNSATAGLHLALEAIGIGPGDAVLVPTLTFTATAEVVRYMGAEVILVDVDPVTLNIDLDDAERRMAPHVKAIMPVHYAGLPLDRHAVAAFAQRHNLKVVDDAAHAFPAAQDGLNVGAWGTEATVFSFYANKTITTGEGGMIVTQDKALAARARVMRTHGMSRDAFDRFRRTGAPWDYDVIAPGFKYNLTDIAAAIGRVQLRKADALRAGREQVARWYLEKLAGLPLILPHEGQDVHHSWHLFPIRLTEAAKMDRDALIAHLSAQEIGTSVHYRPLHRMTYWASVNTADPDSFPVADAYFKSALSLPCFPGMTQAQADTVCAAIAAAIA